MCGEKSAAGSLGIRKYENATKGWSQGASQGADFERTTGVQQDMVQGDECVFSPRKWRSKNDLRLQNLSPLRLWMLER